MSDKVRITEMPDRNLLADFLEGLHGLVSVIFNTDTGRFERIRASDQDAQEAGRPGAGSPPAGGNGHV